MNDTTTEPIEQKPDPAAGPTAPSPAPAAPAAPRDEIDDLLSDPAFAPATPAAEKTAEPATSAPVPIGHHEDVVTLIAAINGLEARDQAREMQRLEQTDGAAVLKLARETAAEFEAVPEGFVERWIVSEYNMDAAFSKAWDNRYSSPDAMKACEKMVNAKMSKLAKELRGRPDARATADYEAVSAAVRGTGKLPPAEDDAAYRRRLSTMGDAEFRQHSAEVMRGT